MKDFIKKNKWYLIVAILYFTNPDGTDIKNMGHDYPEKQFDFLIGSVYKTSDGLYLGILKNGIKIGDSYSYGVKNYRPQ
jgi:hypothetical protein